MPTLLHEIPALLRETDAAAYIGLSVRTLRRWRFIGKGPTFRKLGSAVRYAVADLNGFLDASRRNSTSATSPPVEETEGGK